MTYLRRSGVRTICVQLQTLRAWLCGRGTSTQTK